MKDTFSRLAHAPRKIVLFVLGMLAVPGLLAPVTAPAKPTSDSQARQVVTGWLKLDRQPLGAAMAPDVKRVETYRNAKGQSLYHVVYLKPAGVVIVGGDDLVEPIVGFLPEATQYDPSEKNPVGALIGRDLAGRVQSTRQAAGKPGLDGELAKEMAVAAQKWSTLAAAEGLTGSEQGLGQISDVRVAPLLKTKWSQATVANQNCYNYYTPNNYVCGCVATAMAQLMRYHQYPVVGVGTGSFSIEVNGVSRTAKLRGGNGSGGPYNWAGMPLVPGASITAAQRQAIGALTYDAGVSVEMSYSSSGSGTDTLMAADSFKQTFKFTNAAKAYYDGYNIPAATIRTMTNPNLDAGYPVLFGISDGQYGHAIVCDGYGFNTTTAYHHLNMGWAGTDDVWYNLPTISTGSIAFNTVYKIVYNIFTSGTGEIISGRVTSASGAPVAGATVTATRSGGGVYTATTNSKGIYALKKIPAASSYTIKATAPGHSFAIKTASTGRSTDMSTTCGNAWAVNFSATVAAPAMTVTPAAGLAAAGNYGGPFAPASAIYTIKNTGKAAMAWSAGKTRNWVTVSPAGGTLAAGASVAVTVSINAGAKALAAGVHRDTVSFTNNTNKVGNTTRAVTLTVNGGATQSFTIYNDGTANLTVSSLALDKAAAWITWDAVTPFTVAPKSSRTVKVYVTYPLAPLGSATRRIVVNSNDTARNPYPGGVTIVTNKKTP